MTIVQPICRPGSALDDIPNCLEENFAAKRLNVNLNFSARDRCKDGIPARYRPKIHGGLQSKSAMVISGGNR